MIGATKWDCSDDCQAEAQLLDALTADLGKLAHKAFITVTTSVNHKSYANRIKSNHARMNLQHPCEGVNSLPELYRA